MKNKIIPILSMFLMLAAFLAPSVNAHANSADQKIKLIASADYRAAKGTAKFRDRGGEKEFQIEVEMPRRFAGTVFHVIVDEALVGQMTVDKFGKGRLALNSRMTAVPAVHAGSLVGVVDQSDVIVLAGQF